MKNTPRAKNHALKIGFQGWFFSEQYTGIGQHSLGLAHALAKKAELVIPVPTSKLPPESKAIPRKFFHVLKPKWWLVFSPLKKWYWERVQVPTFFARQNLDAEYFPYPSPLPRTSVRPRFVTVHDLILWQDPRYKDLKTLRGKLKNYYHKLALRSLINADHIFTVSETTKKRLGIPAATVLPNAIPPLPKIITLKKYANSLVYLGGFDARKNIALLVRAHKAAQKKFPNLQIVLIGAPLHKSKFYAPLPTGNGIETTGFIPDKTVYQILASSLAFVNFSDEEGFNIPLLQAMSVGTPAIVADIPVNHEISTESALFFNPSQKDPLSDKIALLKDTKFRKEIITAELAAARRFTWERTAKIFFSALELTLKHAKK
jgi:glycosyltransferase involved in cell wall biosynthesis